MSMSEPSKSGFFYLKYVKLGQAYSEINGTLWAWIILSIIILVLGGMGSLGAESLGIDATKKLIPNEAWYFILFGFLTWFYRGQHIVFDIPKFTFWQWALLNASCMLFAGIAYVSPWWVLMPLYIGFFLFVGCYETLVAMGKENFEIESGLIKPEMDEAEFYD